MSAWQFKVSILPASGLIAHFGCIPEHIEVVRFTDSVPFEDLERRSDELPDYWECFDDSEALEKAIEELIPERESWSSLARMFGENGKDEIEVWRREDGQLSRLTLSCSLSEPNPEFIRKLLDVASCFNLKLLAAQSQRVFDPSIASFVTQAEKCSAARFIPPGTILADVLEIA